MLVTTSRLLKSDPLKLVFRMMYWTDWGQDAKIERASMDGSARSVIIDVDLGWPNGLTLDYSSQTLYWTDAELDRLERAKVDGSHRGLIVTPTNVVLHPFGITFFKNRIYWSDWETNALLIAPVSRSLTETEVFVTINFD